VIRVLERETKTQQACKIRLPYYGAAKEVILIACYVTLTSKEISTFRTNIPPFFRVYEPLDCAFGLLNLAKRYEPNKVVFSTLLFPLFQLQIKFCVF